MSDSPRHDSDTIKRLAAELGFDACGIAGAGPIRRADYLRDWLAAGRAGSMAYLHRHLESRVDLTSWLPWARSVIVVATRYDRAAPPMPLDRPRGRVAMYAWDADYHTVLRGRLETLLDRLRDALGSPLEARICVDTAAIVERELAEAAGIGWVGKNTLVMNAAIGSTFFLGEIITDRPLAPDAPATDRCGRCTRCLDACPTGALTAPYQMDAGRCISYLTIEHRDDIDDNLAAEMNDWVFGCDECQTVCPHNRPRPGETVEPVDTDAAFPPLDEITDWDQSAYRHAVKGKAQSRAKLQMWQRNAEIARGNAAQLGES